MSTRKTPSWGVKTTLKRDATTPEFSMQVLSEVDTSLSTPAKTGKAKVEKRTKADPKNEGDQKLTFIANNAGSAVKDGSWATVGKPERQRVGRESESPQTTATTTATTTTATGEYGDAHGGSPGGMEDAVARF